MSYLLKLLGAAPPVPAREPSGYAWAPSLSLLTASGQHIGPDAALKISTAWACIGLLSECVAMLPKFVFQNLPNGGRDKALNHPLFDVVHSAPNYQQTAFEFFEMMTAHAIMRGNAYARIVPGPRGPADQLIPLHPDRVMPEPIPDNRLRYRVMGANGKMDVLNDEDILHLRGRSLDGITGLSVISYARESFGLSLGAEAYGARFFGNDSRPGGVLRTDRKLSDEAGKRLKSSWEAAHAAGNQHRVAVLEEGLEWQATGIPPKDAQMLELREFQAEDVCRWFRVPPHMVGLTSKATSWGSGIEQMSIGFVVYTLLPWLTRWQQAISRDLIIAPQTYLVEFVVEGLLRGDMLSRYNAYKIGREIGLLNPNEIRRLENLNPRDDPGGDAYADMASAGAPAQPSQGGAGADNETAPSIEDAIRADAAKAEMAEALIRAGYKQQDVLKAVGLPAMEDWGAPPVTLQSQSALKEPPKGSGAAWAHYERLRAESAGRVVRKEIAAMSKAAKRGGDWAEAVTEFYSDHAAHVAKALAVSVAVAEIYAAGQARALLEGGPAAMTSDWETRSVAHLTSMMPEVA